MLKFYIQSIEISKCYSAKWDLMVNQEGDFYRYVDTDDFFVHTTLDLGGEANLIVFYRDY